MLLTCQMNASVDHAREMRAHRGEMATVGQPAVEGARDDLAPHCGADQLNAGCLVGLNQRWFRLAGHLIDGQALAGIVAAAVGGAASQMLATRTGTSHIQYGMLGHCMRMAKKEIERERER